MNIRPRALVFFVVLLLCVIFIPGCAREQQLTAIQIQPSAATFGASDPGLFVNFKAFGTYEHPPQQKDITNVVTWQSNTPQVATVTSAGVVSPSTGCGVSDVFATLHDHASGSDIVSNSSTVTVNGPAALGCTPAGPQPVLTVQFAGTGQGQISSSPSGLSCQGGLGTTCSNTFTIGTTITLTENPIGSSSFAGWSGGCNQTSATTCTLFLENSVTVTASFN